MALSLPSMAPAGVNLQPPFPILSPIQAMVLGNNVMKSPRQSSAVLYMLNHGFVANWQRDYDRVSYLLGSYASESTYNFRGAM